MAYLGFDRRITLTWLDETAGVVLHTTDPVAVRAALPTQFAQDIAGAEARVKTITLLCRVWLNPPTAPHLRDAALGLQPKTINPERQQRTDKEPPCTPSAPARRSTSG